MRLSALLQWRKLRWGLLGIGAANQSPHDKPIETIAIKNRYENSEELDGWTRLSYVFKSQSPEMNDIMSSTTLAYISGFVLGGFSTSRNAYRRFVEEHKHTLFKHPRDAQSKLREHIFLGLFKGGIKFGAHLALLTFIFTVSTSCCVVYRNYLNPLDHTLCGALLGSSYTLIRGPKAALVGGFLGSSFGLTCGLVSLGAEKLSGESAKERWLREFRAIKDSEERAYERQKAILPDWSYQEDTEHEDEHPLDKYLRIVLNKLREIFSLN
ncbi:complex I assembly factor TIMMDC1, mitochondrial [Lepeophtheirus salmonis]|uniref:Complex I assembly factor TIMMDC1, mitochondrial n=1 Tax=Lepeophtheirus salmonis TaxID=72036 RepID=A0A0K2TGX7_LEPSM|nr:RPII140-upstream gene protein-like [Lepeophtheirus salmonis]